MLVEIIAKSINENAQCGNHWINTEKYDFLYSPYNRESLDLWLMADSVTGRNSINVTEWNGYKLYHEERGGYSLDTTFVFECPSGNLFYFSAFYKHSTRDLNISDINC